MNPSRRIMIADANVLIDLLRTDRLILSSIVEYIGPLYVSTPVAEEVSREANQAELKSLGITIVEPTEEEENLSCSNLGPLSMEDRICLFTAKQRHWICVTNDQPLAKQCKAHGVSVIRCLRLLCILYRNGGISQTEVVKLAHRIQEQNRFITLDLIHEFEWLLEHPEKDPVL